MGTLASRSQDRCPECYGRDEWGTAKVRAGPLKVLQNPKRWGNCLKI